jgi:hypothetical protein
MTRALTRRVGHVSGQKTGEARAREFSDWWLDAGEAELRQLLYWVWDPIDLNQAFPDASDEYDGYALEIATALASGMSQSTLAALLGSIEQNRMGMTARPLDLIAERLRTWYQRSTQRYRTRACAGV